MYLRHLFVGYKELPHSSSLVQATGLVASSSILAFSFSPSACLSFFLYFGSRPISDGASSC